MELLNKIEYFDTENKSFITSVAIYKDGIWFKILIETGKNISGECRLGKQDAIEYYILQINGIRKSLIVRQIIFTSHESQTNQTTYLQLREMLE